MQRITGEVVERLRARLPGGTLDTAADIFEQMMKQDRSSANSWTLAAYDHLGTRVEAAQPSFRLACASRSPELDVAALNFASRADRPRKAMACPTMQRSRNQQLGRLHGFDGSR